MQCGNYTNIYSGSITLFKVIHRNFELRHLPVKSGFKPSYQNIAIMDTKKLEQLPNKDGGIEKGKSHIIVELIEYEQNETVSKSIMKKATGSIDAMSFDSGEGLNQKTSPFDTYLQVIDGSAIISVNDKDTKLEIGEGILIPAHASSHVEPNGRFKLLLTIIKSGYEE